MRNTKHCHQGVTQQHKYSEPQVRVPVLKSERSPGCAQAFPRFQEHQVLRMGTPLLQVYLAVAALLANGGQAKAAKLVARANVDSISSDATKGYKHLKRGVARGVANPLDMLRGRTHKAAEPQAAPLFVAPRSARSPLAAECATFLMPTEPGAGTATTLCLRL